MPRYFFHVRDGKNIRDDEGTEFPSLAVARATAVKFAGVLLAEHDGDFWASAEWQMDVTDEKGLLLFMLMFSGTLAPAARGAMSVS